MSTDISVVELKKRLDAGETINLIDVLSDQGLNSD